MQGVGFRATARSLAQGHAIAGTVENLRDGSVALVVEGHPTEIERFLEALGQRFADKIHGAECTDLPTGEPPLAGFTIRY